MQVGLEVEYWVTDNEGRLTTADDLIHDDRNIEQEFVEPLLEIKTDPHPETAGIRTDLRQQLRTVLDRAHEAGKRLVPLGTTLLPEQAEVLSKRGAIQERVLGDRLQYAKNVAGTHLHFDQEHVLPELNLLTALDPALALLNSSPLYGERIASSARNEIYRNRCYSEFPQHGQLWEYADSLREWKKRIQQRFQEFREAARQNGISGETFDTYFTPEETIWTPIRLRDRFDTIEWRAPDTALPTQVLQFTEDITQIVEQTSHKDVMIGSPGIGDSIQLPPFEDLLELVDESIRNGLRSEKVRNYLTALDIDVTAYSPLSGDINRRDEPTPREAREIRLTYADRLEQNIQQL